jgi:hypothetical protein
LLWTAPLPRDLQRLEAALRRLAGSTRSPA